MAEDVQILSFEPDLGPVDRGLDRIGERADKGFVVKLRTEEGEPLGRATGESAPVRRQRPPEQRQQEEDVSRRQEVEQRLFAQDEQRKRASREAAERANAAAFAAGKIPSQQVSARIAGTGDNELDRLLNDVNRETKEGARERLIAERRERDNRRAVRLLGRVPEEDRPNVEMTAGRRMRELGESRMEALNESLRVYRQDAQEHRRFLGERNQAQAQIVSGYRDLARDTISGLRRDDLRDRRRFAADLADLSPPRQLRAIRERMAGMDPADEEFTSLRRQANALGSKTGLNREILGMGNYMSALFGGWEISSALAGVRTGELGARVALNPQDALRSQLQGLQQATGGIIGGMVREIGNAIGSFTPLPSLAKFEEQVTVEAARAANLDFVRQGRMQAEFAAAERQAFRTGGASGRARQQILNQFQDRRRALIEESGDLSSQLNMPVETLAANIQTGAAGGLFPGTGRQEMQATLRRERAETGEMAAMRARRDEFLKRQRDLDDAQRQEIQEIDRQIYQSIQVERDRAIILGARNQNVPVREIAREERRRRFDIERSEAQATGGDAMVAETRERQRQQEIAEEREANRQGTLRRNQFAGGIASSRLRARNDRFGASLTDLIGENARLVTEALPEDRTRAVQMAGARLSEFFATTRRTIQHASDDIDTTNRVAARVLARDPIGASMEAVEGRRRQVLRDLPDNWIFNNLLGGNRLREGIEDRARGEVLQQIQSRADQITDINRNQATRREQLRALQQRNPVGAEVAGIVGAARDREQGLLREKLDSQAAQERLLAQEQLALTKRDYLESFRGVQAGNSEQLFALFNRRDNENPALTMKSIEDGIKGLNKPGTVETPEEVQKQIRDEIMSLRADLKALAQN